MWTTFDKLNLRQGYNFVKCTRTPSKMEIETLFTGLRSIKVFVTHFVQKYALQQAFFFNHNSMTFEVIWNLLNLN